MTIAKDIKKKRLLLEKRINNLKNSFSFKQGAHGPTNKQQDKLRGFVLLCHAEIEDYLESIASLLLDNAYKLWLRKRLANFTLTSFLLRFKKEFDHTLTIDNEIYQLKKLYLEEISRNHGIKQDNIRKMFKPLGYKINDFSSALIAELDSLGASRGEIAHVASYRAQTLLDKETIYSKIERIISELEIFENKILEKI